MSLLKLLLVLVMTLFLCPAAVSGETGPGSAKLKLIVPDANWERLYFGVINNQTANMGLPDLRSEHLPKGSFEARLWIGFGTRPLQGFIIKKDKEGWSGLHIPPVNSPTKDDLKDVSPKSGWEKLWVRLVEEGMLSLPDSSELKGEVFDLDGDSYVIETNADNIYRTYQYSNPELQSWPEAKHVTEISRILFEEFGIEGESTRPAKQEPATR